MTSDMYLRVLHYKFCSTWKIDESTIWQNSLSYATAEPKTKDEIDKELMDMLMNSAIANHFVLILFESETPKEYGCYKDGKYYGCYRKNKKFDFHYLWNSQLSVAKNIDDMMNAFNCYHNGNISYQKVCDITYSV